MQWQGVYIAAAVAGSILLGAPHGAGASAIVARALPGGADPRCDTATGLLVVAVTAELGGDAVAAGITMGEFRVRGLEAFLTSFAPNPTANLALPLPGGGFAIAFSSCQAAPSVLLGSITVVGYGGEPLELRVEGSGSRPQCPANPALLGCEAPEHSLVCAPITVSCVNNPACCTVGLSAATWAGTKSLFK